MNTRPIFYKQVLSNGDVVDVHELTGEDWYNASRSAGQNVGTIPFFLVEECCTIRRKKISLEYIKKLSFSDAQKLIEVVSTQMNTI